MVPDATPDPVPIALAVEPMVLTQGLIGLAIALLVIIALSDLALRR